MNNTPSDAEIIELMRDGYNCRYNDEADHIEFARAVLAKWAAHQQEAQEPSHRETVDVVGVRSNGEHVNLEKIAMPPRMKAREIAIEQFGSFKDDDGSDAEMCFGALEYFLEWLIQQGWSKAPQPAPVPLSDEAKDAMRWRETLMHIGAANHLGGQHFTLNTLRISDQMFLLRGSASQHFTKCIDESIARRAAIAAQGGKDAE